MKTLLMLVLLASLAACGGAGSPASLSPVSPSPSTPGSPGGSSRQWLAGIGSVGIASASYGINLLKVEFYLDGNLDKSITFDPTCQGLGCFGYNANRDYSQASFSPGQHTISIRVVAQRSSPHVYDHRSFFFGRDGEVINITCPNQHSAIATGGEMSCSFTLPS